MVLQIPDVLNAEQVAQARRLLDARRVGGRPRHRRPPVGADEGQPAAARGPSGRAAARRVDPRRAAAQPAVRLGGAAAAGVSAALQPLPRRAVVRQPRGQRHPAGRGPPASTIRTDLSATLFLTEPDEYDGGELMVEDTYGVHSRQAAGRAHGAVSRRRSLHNVTPVTRGARIASFFWIQSMVRDDGERTLLFDLDTAIQRLTRRPARSSRRRAADVGLSQPAPPLGRGLGVARIASQESARFVPPRPILAETATRSVVSL